jgi:hypothetical protein
MTITPARDTAPATLGTISARNRVRRRAAGGTEPRHAIEELSPPRRRNGGRHAAEIHKPETLADLAPDGSAWVVPDEIRTVLPEPEPPVSALPSEAERFEAFFAGEEQADSYPRIRRRRRAKRGFLAGAVVRCCLYVGPLSVAVAGAPSLRLVAWPVTAVLLVLGWGAAQALTSMGVVVARRTGTSAAARLVGAGFTSVTALWCALVWIAPDALLGPSRWLAATVGVCGLMAFAGLTVALVTRSEGSIALWFVPCWLLAGIATAGALGVPWASAVPVELMLPGAIIAVVVRAFRPVALSQPERSRLTGIDRRRGFAYLVIGASQAACVTTLWQAGTPFPAALPLLIAVPMLEGLIGWHTERLDAGLDSAESTDELGRHIRNITAITLAGLLPPLAAGIGLTVAAYQLPELRDGVLALAAGTLLGGVFAVTFLLAARSRAGVAAALATVPVLAAAVITLFPAPSGPLPPAVAVLASVHLAGLLIVALTAVDLRRTP